MQLISYFFFLCYELHLLSLQLLHSEGHCSVLPSTWRPDPSIQPLLMHQDPLCCSKTTASPDYLADTLSPVISGQVAPTVYTVYFTKH